MKERHSEPSELLTDRRKRQVRYVGFEGIEGGRRLMFRIKSVGEHPVDVAFDVPNGVFIAVPGISIQDAVPMAYEKLNDLSSAETLNEKDFYLTPEDIANYKKRHTTSQQKTAHSMDKDDKRSNVAA